MTDLEKKARLAELIAPDEVTDDLLYFLLQISEGIVLNRRFPFGPPEGSTVPKQYEHIQLQIAVELYSKRGAEGQTMHIENGIHRTYESADVSKSLLNKITPMVGSVK